MQSNCTININDTIDNNNDNSGDNGSLPSSILPSPLSFV